MTVLLVGIGEFEATSLPGFSIKTLALGSCVAVIILDPKTHTIGLAHVALPDSSIDADKARTQPGYFADTAIPALLARMAKHGAQGKGLLVKLAGGASVLNDSNTFNIGKRNALAIKKLLWKYGMGPLAEDLGGEVSRTVEVFVDTGIARISTPGRPLREI